MSTTETETETQSLVAEMRRLRADFSRVGDALHDIVRKRGDHALEGAEDAAAKIWAEARKRTDGIAREIEDKPLVAAVGAFGLGMLLGMMFSSRRG